MFLLEFKPAWRLLGILTQISKDLMKNILKIFLDSLNILFGDQVHLVRKFVDL